MANPFTSPPHRLGGKSSSFTLCEESSPFAINPLLEKPTPSPPPPSLSSMSMEIFGPRNERIFNHPPALRCVIFVVFFINKMGKSVLAASGKNNNFPLQFGSVLRRDLLAALPTPKSPTAIATAIFRSQVTNIRGVFIAN